MTIAYVKNSDGSGAVVQNTFRDAAGTLHTLSNFYTDINGTQFQVFFDDIPSVPLGISSRLFKATDIRTFVATDNRMFKV